jgi:hypothetical protein
LGVSPVKFGSPVFLSIAAQSLVESVRGSNAREQEQQQQPW